MKSRFISFIYPIHSPDDVKPLVEALKKEYFDARHHCYAWRLEENSVGEDYSGAMFRTADDREPAHTAGEPILAAIDSNELKNVLVVVVRYFGGIKLGASNLSKAYRTAAQNAVNEAEIITCVPKKDIIFSFDFSVISQVNKFLKDNNFTKEDYSYLEANKIKLSADIDLYDNLINQLSSVYGITL